MDVALFFVFLICDLIIVPICWFSYGKQGEYREGMVMGVHIPAHAVEDPEVKKICGKIQKHWNRFHQINLLLSVLICFLCLYNFTLFIIVWSVWLAEYVAVLYGLIIVPHRQMYRLKLKRGWVDAASMRVVRIDTSVPALSGKMALNWKWHLPSVILTAATALLLYNMGERYRLSPAEMTVEWALYASGVFTCLLFLVLHIGIVRQANRVYSENTEINLAANRLMKRAWSQGLALASWISGGAWISLAVCGSISGPDLPAGCYGVYAFLLMISAAALLVPLGLAVGKKKEILSADQAPCYVDDDAYWKNGWYSNPDDPHLFVMDRMNDMQFTMNMARPAAKAIVAVTAAAVVALLLFVAAVILNFENAEVTFVRENDTITIEAAGYDCKFAVDEVKSAELIGRLPDDRYIRTNGGSTDRYDFGYYRGKQTGKCMMFLYSGYQPILKIQLNDLTVFVNSKSSGEAEEWYRQLNDVS